MKKLLMTLLGVFTMLPAFSQDFSYTYEGKSIHYQVIDEEAKTVRTCSFSGYVEPYWGNIIIPSEVSYEDNIYTVVEIGPSTFSSCSSLTSVTIPNSVSLIGSWAFYGCRGLTEAEFSSIEHLCSIEFENAFANPLTNAHHLYINGEEVTEVVIPETVTLINDYAFYNCSGLTSMKIGNSVSSIGNSAFKGCSGLTEVIIGNSVTSIGYEAFRGCSGLCSVTIGNSVKLILASAFYGCNGLAKVDFSSIEHLCSIEFDGDISNPLYYAHNLYINGEEVKDAVIPESVTSIGDWTFYGCSGLTSVTIPDSVTSIGYEAFRGCSGLTSVTIGNSVTTIGDYAFYDCSGLPSVTLPNSLVSIGYRAFEGCNSMNKVTSLSVIPPSMREGMYRPDEGSFSYNLYDNAILEVDESSLAAYLSTKWSLFKNILLIGQDEILPNTTYTDGILNYRLLPPSKENENNLAIVISGDYSGEITIPERFTYANSKRYYVKGIGYAAFKNSAVTSISFNSRSQLEIIGEYAFSNCNNLKSIVLPETVSSIRNFAFYYCTGLSSVIIPNSVTSIGAGAFSGCYVLTSVTIPNSVNAIEPSTFSSCRGLTSVTIPNSVTSIGDGAFHDCSGLTSVTIGNSVNSIGYETFSGCSGLTSVVIPNSVISIGDRAFSLCSGLSSMTIGNSVTSIGGGAFSECSRLTSVTIGNSVSSIGDGAFSYCISLSSLTVPNSVISIGKYAFENCSGLTSLSLADGLLPLNVGSDAFKDVNLKSLHIGRPIENQPFVYGSLELLSIGNTITEIAPSMWSGAINLTSLILGNGLTSIGDNAFWDCRALKQVIVPPSVETIGYSAFSQNTSLETVIMGHNIKSIEDKAFDGCPAKNTYITAPEPPAAFNTTFSNYSGVLWLQDENALDAYYDAPMCWDRFESKCMVVPTEMKFDGPESITGEPAETFQLSATLVPENVTLPQIFWRSTNPEIATVDHNGLVTLHRSVSNSMAAEESEQQAKCVIIGESLYANGPVVKVTVNKNPSGVEDIVVRSDGKNGEIDFSSSVEVYNLNGVCVSNSMKDLVPGIYIVRQGKTVKKIAVK